MHFTLAQGGRLAARLFPLEFARSSSLRIPTECRNRGRARLGLSPLLALATCALFVAPAVFAAPPARNEQTPLKSLTLEQLGNLEVTTVSKEPEAVWKTPAAIYVITQEDIQRSGAENIPEALRLAPGVEVARITSGEYAIGIRGFNSRLSRSVLVLIDGRTAYTTFTAGTYWETQDTMLKDVDRIEVIRGPGGTIWGPNAVNGVINIITKKAQDTQGTLVDGGGGNVLREFGDARYGATTRNGFAYRAYLKGFGWAPQYHSDGDNYDDWHGVQGGFRMDWDASGRDAYQLQGSVYRQEFGERVVESTYNPPANIDTSGDVPLYGGNVLWNWRRALGDGRDIAITAYYAHDTRDELNFGDIRDTGDVDLIHRFRLPGQELSWGGTLRWSHGNERQVVTGLTFTPTHRTDQLYQAFVQDEIRILPDRLSLTAGTKVLKTNYTGVLAEPTARLLFTPTPKQTLWAAYTHAIRTPADVERDFSLSSYLGNASSGLPIFARFTANPNFKSEQMNGYEAGYRTLASSTFYVDIASFYNYYSSLFSEDLLGAPYVENNPAPVHVLIPAEFGNGLVASTTGGEIAPQWRPASWLSLSGSYTFLDMHVKKDPNSQDIGSAATVQGSSPAHQALVQAGVTFPKSLTTQIQARYVSELPGIKVPAYWTGDATLRWNARKHFQLSLAGRNLLQPHHVEFSYDPGPNVGIRRSFYGEVTIH